MYFMRKIMKTYIISLILISNRAHLIRFLRVVQSNNITNAYKKQQYSNNITKYELASEL